MLQVINIHTPPFFSPLLLFRAFPHLAGALVQVREVASCLAGLLKMNALMNQAQRGAQSSTLKTKSSALSGLRLKIIKKKKKKKKKRKKIVVFYLKLCKARSAGPADSVAVVVTESTGDCFFGG